MNEEKQIIITKSQLKRLIQKADTNNGNLSSGVVQKTVLGEAKDMVALLVHDFKQRYATYVKNATSKGITNKNNLIGISEFKSMLRSELDKITKI